MSTEPFDWTALPAGATAFWETGGALFREQKARLAVDGIEPVDRSDGEGSLWTPAVDFDLDEKVTGGLVDGGKSFMPARETWRIASASSPALLLRGTILRLEAVIPDRFLEGLGTNFWSTEDASLDVRYIHSALEGRWGPAALLADGLIVPIDHPIVGNDERAERLVRDLQQITRDFRSKNGLPADGGHARPMSSLGPIDAHLAYVNGQLRQIADRRSVVLATGLEGIVVAPQSYPVTSISPDTYGDRTGTWGDGADWLEYWAGLGGTWVNLTLVIDEAGQPCIRYESQWRKGDIIERLPDGRYPAFNFYW